MLDAYRVSFGAKYFYNVEIQRLEDQGGPAVIHGGNEKGVGRAHVKNGASNNLKDSMRGEQRQHRSRFWVETTSVA